ncbi:hypothetical protein [Chitinimonas taiwanensis]|uniref:hypothetical protein n=1 Tax=Chitinimonas taiwanensis TaxID=240412 RepID=UPI0011147E31|nr:hypothetical protein [Chitinimonas taiwanensis]
MRAIGEKTLGGVDKAGGVARRKKRPQIMHKRHGALSTGKKIAKWLKFLANRTYPQKGLPFI